MSQSDSDTKSEGATDVPPKKTAAEIAAEEKIFPTEWTSTQPPGGRYMIRAGGFTPALVPGQRVTGYVGRGRKRVEASVPHLRYEKWIDEAGNVRAVPIETTRVWEDGAPNDREGVYHLQITNELRRAGFVNYKTGDGAPRDFQLDWPERREDLIALRQNEQRLAMEDVEKRRANELRADEVKRDHALFNAMQAMVENMNKKGKK